MAFKKIPMLFCLQYAQSYNSISLWYVNQMGGWSDANGKGHLGPVSTSWVWWKQVPKFLSACSFPNHTEPPTHLYIGSLWGHCHWTCKHTWKSSFKEEFETSSKVDRRQKPGHWDLPTASLDLPLICFTGVFLPLEERHKCANKSQPWDGGRLHCWDGTAVSGRSSFFSQ